MRRFLLPASSKPYPGARRRSPSGLLAGLALLLSACAGAPQPSGGDWDAQQLARREQRVAEGAIGARDSKAEMALRSDLCQIDPVACGSIRVYVVDRPEAQARLWPNDMLIVSGGLLRLMAAGDANADAMRRFALAHEVAHRQLGHFDRRDRRDWNADAAEREADDYAIEALKAAQLPPDAGIRLLQAIITERGENARSAKRLRGRIAAMRRVIEPRIEGNPGTAAGDNSSAAVRGKPPIKSASGAGSVEA